MNPHSKPRPSEEERLMALLALDTQELPERGSSPPHDLAALDGKAMTSAQISQLHAYLDAHPEAFEEVLRQRAAMTHRNASAARSWREQLANWLMPVPRYAIALGASAVFTALVSLMWIDNPSRLGESVDLAYVELSERAPAQALVDIAEAQSQAEARLGFSGSAQPTDAAAAFFVEGFEAGRQRLLEPGETSAQTATANEAMYVLGQWNALLWTASQLPEPLSTEFWSAQREHFQEFSSDVRRQRRVDPVVIVHVQRIEALLAQLSQRNTARPLHELSQELQLFRARFVP
jgi:hypothetical protein